MGRAVVVAASWSLLLAWVLDVARAAAQPDEGASSTAAESSTAASSGSLAARADAASDDLAPSEAAEPSVDAVVRAALATGRLDPSRTHEAAERARLSGLLPQVRADLRRGQVIDLSALTGATGERSAWSSGDQLSLGAQVVFALDRLAFAPEEPALLRERRHLEDRRLELVARVIGLYFERRRLLLDAAQQGPAGAALRLRIAEIEALLDALTDGFVSSARRPRA